MPRTLLSLLGLLLLATPLVAGTLTVTVTLPDDVLAAVRQYYTTTPGTPASDARLQEVSQHLLTQAFEQAGTQYIQVLGQKLSVVWTAVEGPQRQNIQQDLEGLVTKYPPPVQTGPSPTR